MATSREARRRTALGARAVSLLALAGLPLLAAAGDSSRARGASGAVRPTGGLLSAEFSWLHPARAPADWTHVTIASGNATLFYPAAWKPIPGDKGTVTASLRDKTGIYHGYLNVTPRQGAERLNGWASFRTRRNREEGDQRVHELASY